MCHLKWHNYYFGQRDIKYISQKQSGDTFSVLAISGVVLKTHSQGNEDKHLFIQLCKPITMYYQDAAQHNSVWVKKIKIHKIAKWIVVNSLLEISHFQMYKTKCSIIVQNSTFILIKTF